MARQFAEDGCEDIRAAGGEAPTELVQLAGIGSNGTQPSHCYRDLLALLKDPILSEPSTITIPVKELSARGWKPDQLAVMDPHVVFHELYHHPDAWHERVLPERVSLTAFWQEQVLRDSPRLQGNGMLEVDNWKELFVPIWIHGDGAPVAGVGKAWGKSMDSWSFGSLLAAGSTKTVAFLIMAIFLATQAAGAAVPYGGTVSLAF